jgi:hypothetical protein
VGAILSVVPVVGGGACRRGGEEAGQFRGYRVERDGGMMLGLSGQTTRTTLGWSLSSSNSIRRSAPLMVPLDRVVDLLTGSSLFQVGDPQPRRVFEHLAGHFCVAG